MLELHAHIVERRLGIVEHYKFLDPERGQLAAQLRADRAGSASNKYCLALEIPYNLVHGDFYLRTVKEILDSDFTD